MPVVEVSLIVLGAEVGAAFLWLSSWFKAPEVHGPALSARETSLAPWQLDRAAAVARDEDDDSTTIAESASAEEEDRYRHDEDLADPLLSSAVSAVLLVSPSANG
ncbi:unnamed protein product [Amoebophrya sp. A120]|nr:unnamed protein product [Amoebophrya sp. A120]|eukprot:GSA120T00004310001.1